MGIRKVDCLVYSFFEHFKEQDKRVQDTIWGKYILSAQYIVLKLKLQSFIKFKSNTYTEYMLFFFQKKLSQDRIDQFLVN